MTIRTRPATLMQSALFQAKTDLRPYYASASGIGLLFPVVVFIALGVWFRSKDLTLGPWASAFLPGMVGATTAMLPLQLVSEYYSERVNGTLIRARLLPNGPLAWTIGKTLSNLTLIALTQGLLLAATLILFPELKIPIGSILLMIPILLLCCAAAAPIGFVLGAFAKGVYSLMGATVALIGLWTVSGSFFPLSDMPTWLQAFQTPLPFYWFGHLSRWALVGGDGSGIEIGGGYHPLLAIAILLAWTILGFALAARIVRSSFRKESLTTLEQLRFALRRQSGI